MMCKALVLRILFQFHHTDLAAPLRPRNFQQVRLHFLAPLPHPTCLMSIEVLPAIQGTHSCYFVKKSILLHK